MSNALLNGREVAETMLVQTRAQVAELADAVDSKSTDL